MRAMALLGLLLLVLPGCFGGSETNEPTPTESATATTSASSTTTSTPPVPVPNQPPVANLTADIDNGTAPLAVNFTLDASDTDGDDLTWTFDADGDGIPDANGTHADLPLVLAHTFNATGQFRAALNVSDGNASIVAIHLVVVQEGGAAAEFEDRGAYLFEFATGHCHAKDYTENPPGVYTSAIGGGTWVFLEDNDIEGLQYEDNHPASGLGLGFELPVEPDCVAGDLTAV